MDTPDQFTVISSQRHQLAEGPFWCGTNQALYWVDIPACQVWRWCSLSGETSHWVMPKKVSAVFTTNTGQLLVVLKDEVAFLDPATGNLNHFCELDTDRPGNRGNDAKVAPDGYLWVGTMDDHEKSCSGRLWRIAPDGGRECMLDDVGISNTLAWDESRGVFYFADSVAGSIYKFPYPEFIDTREAGGVFAKVADGIAPDGSAIDASGCLWNAQWGGWKVVRYSHDGMQVEILRVPMQKPTSCCFGGPNGDTLFITSASIGLSDEELGGQDLAGHVIAIPVETTGSASRPFVCA